MGLGTREKETVRGIERWADVRGKDQDVGKNVRKPQNLKGGGGAEDRGPQEKGQGFFWPAQTGKAGQVTSGKELSFTKTTQTGGKVQFGNPCPGRKSMEKKRVVVNH